MGTRPGLIFCADGNPAHQATARAAGWELGARLPAKGMPPPPLAFADQEWKKPDRTAYMQKLAEAKPDLATVLDWEREEQFGDVMSWADEASQHVRQAVLVIPKVPGLVPMIPRRVSGKDVWLAYSVPTAYGGSPLCLWEFAGWPVHLLGGSPQAQRDCYRYLRACAEVRSVDGNMHKKMATSRCLYWTRESTRHGHWQTLNRAVETGGPNEAFRRSCENIAAAWDVWSM